MKITSNTSVSPPKSTRAFGLKMSQKFSKGLNTYFVNIGNNYNKAKKKAFLNWKAFQ